MMGYSLWIVGILIGLGSCQTPADYLIMDLPLYSGPALTFKQYAGYMPLDDEDETSLFFWFVESQGNPATDAVSLWLNGGPGASSIADGFWQEHGPFRLGQFGNSVLPYNWAWNNISNVIYLESPSGVGFSYSNKKTGYNCSDEKTAAINYLFLDKFFTVFTDFATQDFYLTGESYGGHYIPQLAMAIIDNNPSWFDRVKGFTIGNPGINSDWYYNTNEYAFQTYLYQHGLLPQQAWLKSFQACNWNQFLTNCSRDFTHPNKACQDANNAALKYVPRIWDPYDIYAPTCHELSSGKYGMTGEEYVKLHTPWLWHVQQKYNLKTEYNPCAERYTPEYMNRIDVLKAIHAFEHYSRIWPIPPIDWRYRNETEDIALLFPKFFAKAPKWKITVYSGDADSAVPFLGTERWINCLNQPVRKDWFNWMMDEDVAGSVKEFAGITFQSIKHCGHMVPSYCPEQGFLLFQQYIKGTFSSPISLE